MKFTKYPGEKGVKLNRAEMKLCALDGVEKLECHVREGAAVFLKSKMTAGELLTAVDSLGRVGSELVERLLTACAAYEAEGNADMSVLDGISPGLLSVLEECGADLDALEELVVEKVVCGG